MLTQAVQDFFKNRATNKDIQFHTNNFQWVNAYSAM
jgi:hypothetical protein